MSAAVLKVSLIRSVTGNPNRGRDGRPKTVLLFDNDERLAVSSQAQNRAVWEGEEKALFKDLEECRTRHFPKFVKEALITKGMPEEDAHTCCAHLVGAMKGDDKKKNGNGKKNGKKKETTNGTTDDLKTNQIVYLSQDEVGEIANLIWEDYQDTEDVDQTCALLATRIRKSPISKPTLDILLRGRMATCLVADVPGCLSTFQARSIDKINVVEEFVTAKDDYQQDHDTDEADGDDDEESNGDRGAALIAERWSTSPCRVMQQFVVDLNGFKGAGKEEGINWLTTEWLPNVIKAFPQAMSTPFGKPSLPEAILVEVFDDVASSQVDNWMAFRDPFPNQDEQNRLGVDGSQILITSRLGQFIGKMDEVYSRRVKRWWCNVDHIPLRYDRENDNGSHTVLELTSDNCKSVQDLVSKVKKHLG